MRLSRTSIQQAVAGVALGTGIIATAGTANAGVLYDLRFAGAQPVGSGSAGDGVHSLGAVPGTYHLELWARVSGTNATNADEGLTNIYTAIASQQQSGGAITAGGLAAGAVVTPFDATGLARNGAANSISADGIVDWGGTSSNLNDTNYMWSRTGTSGGETGGGTLGQANNSSGIGWEFKVATFDLTVGATGGTGVTAFNPVKPNATFTGTSIVTATYVVSKVDNTTLNITTANQASQGTYTNSLGVSLVPVPEPTAIGLLGVGAVGLISRKRRK